MYRANNRRNNDGSGVRGPNSALTQFLKEQGISAENIRERWLETQKNKSEEAADISKDDSETESDEETPKTVTKKKVVKNLKEDDTSSSSDDCTSQGLSSSPIGLDASLV